MRARSCARTVDAIRSNVLTGNITEEFDRCVNDEKKMDESLIRFRSSVIVADVQALKSEVEILKRSLEEEKEARRTGDALGGEAVLQVQAILELEGKQRVTSESKLEGQFKTALSKLYDDVSDLRRGTRDAGTSNDVRTLRLELDREIRHRFEELSKLVHVNQRNTHEHSSARLSEIMRRIEDEREERQVEVRSIHQELSSLSDGKLVHMNQRNMYELSSARLSEIMRRLEDEREERQMEVRSIHEELTTLVEKTSLSLEEEASRLWEALHSHNHDIIIEDNNNSNQISNVKIQGMVNMTGVTSPRTPCKIQPNQSDKPPLTKIRDMLHQADGQGAYHKGANQPQLLETSIYQTNGKGAHHQEANQHQEAYYHRSPQHNYRSLDQQPRIFSPGVYPE